MDQKNVLGAIGTASDRLLHQVTENVELCGRIMGILGMLIDIASSRGASLEGVQVGDVVMYGRRMTAHVTFSRLAIPRRFEATPEAQAFGEYLAKEAAGLNLFVAKNPDLVKWLTQVVTKLDFFCRDKGKRFAELTFSGQATEQAKKLPGDYGCFMTPDDYLVLEVDP